MGAALGRGYQVDVALLGPFAALRKPYRRPVGGLGVSLEAAHEGLLGYALDALQGVQQIVREAVLVEPLLDLATRLVFETHLEPGTQHRLGT